MRKYLCIASVIVLFFACPVQQKLNITKVYFHYETPPQSFTIKAGENLPITAKFYYTGEGSAAYEWYVNNNRVPGANTATYNFSRTPEQTKIYTIKAVIYPFDNASEKKSYEIPIKVLGKAEPVATLFSETYSAPAQNKYLTTSSKTLKFSVKGLLNETETSMKDWLFKWYINNNIQIENTNEFSFSKEADKQTDYELKVRCTSPNGTTTTLQTIITVVPQGETPAVLISNIPQNFSIQYNYNFTIKTSFYAPTADTEWKWYIQKIEEPQQPYEVQKDATTSTFDFLQNPEETTTYKVKVELTSNSVTVSDEVQVLVVNNSVALKTEEGRNINLEQIPGTGTVNFTYDFGNSKKDVIFIFANSSSSETPANSFNLNYENTVNNNFNTVPKIIQETNAKLPEVEIPKSRGLNFNTSYKDEIPGVEKPFFSYQEKDPPKISATLSKMTEEITTELDEKTRKLKIWVQTDKLKTNGGEITEEMITQISDLFLKPGDFNDIFDYVTSIYGEEWGLLSITSPKQITTLPTDPREISILICDIDNDGDNGNILGYFHPRDNFIRTENTGRIYDYSNERLMFTIDSERLSNPDTKDNKIWDITDPDPDLIVSTLAHEFQHMIHFYRKQKEGCTSSSTWFNEMCSMVTEDFVSSMINTRGPRGIRDLYVEPGATGGDAGDANLPDCRITSFNKATTTSPTPTNDQWKAAGSTVTDYYASAYSLGSYLTRNYGGVELFSRMVNNDKTGIEAVNEALLDLGYTDTLNEIIPKWGASIILSKYLITHEANPDMPQGYLINTGTWFNSEINTKNYNYGSINYFNYPISSFSEGPQIMTTKPSEMAGNSIYFYKGGELLTGQHSWEFHIPQNVTVTAVFISEE
jgi:hypothetical protein